LRACQREQRWQPKYQWPASAISVGVMGLGTSVRTPSKRCGE